MVDPSYVVNLKVLVLVVDDGFVIALLICIWNTSEIDELPTITVIVSAEAEQEIVTPSGISIVQVRVPELTDTSEGATSWMEPPAGIATSRFVYTMSAALLDWTVDGLDSTLTLVRMPATKR